MTEAGEIEDFVACRVLGETARLIALAPARGLDPVVDPLTGEEEEPGWTWLPKRAVRFTGDGEIALPEGLAKRAGLI